MVLSLFLVLILTLLSIAIHFAGLFLLLHFLRRNAVHIAGTRTKKTFIRQGVLMIATALGVFVIHWIEIWMYALGFVAVGALDDIKTALYFSASSYSTIGFGDVVLSPDWRLFSAFEGVTGLVLIGWSSAFLLSVTSRLRLLEHDWDTYAVRKRAARKRN